MHKYLRSIGLGEYRNRQQMERLGEAVLEAPGWQDSIAENGDTRAYVARMFGPGFGVMLSGDWDPDKRVFHQEIIYPFLIGDRVTVNSCMSVQRLTDRDAYNGMCEEGDMGLSLIFSVQNVPEIRRAALPPYFDKALPVSMAALSDTGKILLPTIYTGKETEKDAEGKEKDRRALMEKARGGDERAIEILTMEDMDLYASISGRLRDEDIYSIVETSFMPCGMESDQYTVVAEILDAQRFVNELSGKGVWQMTIACKDLVFPVIIAEEDLLGEPAPGRRFKGDLWLQGRIHV
ncbi:MAG: DUF3881 family protein [Lachnospiraceae bacterium]|nr:DUF3881 family protein [Lachnospiraceae bacterium]